MSSLTVQTSNPFAGPSCHDREDRCVSPTEFWTSVLHERLQAWDGVDNSSPPATVDAALARIEEEISAMEGAMLAGRRRHNALLPIAHLLPDILPRVFNFLTLDKPRIPDADLNDVKSYAVRQQVALGWIKVTHVCVAWRDAALSHPYLWSTLFSRASTKWTAEMVSRSKAAPLSYIADSSSNYNGPLTFMEGPLGSMILPRLRYLYWDISATMFTNEDVRLRSIMESMPVLRTLLFMNIYSIEHLPELIKEVALPALRRLTLQNTFPASWTARMMHHLTHLEIIVDPDSFDAEYSSDDQDASSERGLPSPSEILLCLSHSPRLESLTLSRILNPPGAGTQHRRQPAVSLPCLTNLNYIGSAAALSCLLEGLDATPAVFSIDNTGTVEEHAHLLDRLIPWLGAESQPPTRSLLIRRDHGKVLALVARSEQTQDPHVKLRIDATETQGSDECNRMWYLFVSFVCGHLRTNRVGIRALTLEGQILSRLGVDGFRKLVADTELANIEELRLLGTDSPAGLPALALLPGDRIYLPKLEYLELYRAPLANARVGDVLLNYFKARRERGKQPVKTLVLRACLKVEDWEADLGEFVKDIISIACFNREFWTSVLHERLHAWDGVDNSSPPATVDAALARIEEEISAMEGAMLAGRRRHNALLPIARLLPDILPRVFDFLTLEEPHISDNFLNDVKTYAIRQQVALGWIKVTHVCGAWRDAALSHPHLWTTLFARASTKWIAEMVSRSKAALLSYIVYTRPSYNGPLTLMDRPLGSMILPRLRYLFWDTSATTFTNEDLRFRSLMESMPVLTTLNLTNYHSTRCLPKLIEEVAPPALRHLTLHNIFPPSWTARMMHNLSHLEIILNSGLDAEWSSDYQDASSERRLPSPSQLLLCLSQSPMLESLSLSCVMDPPSAGEHLRHQRTVSLPCLTKLNYIGSAATLSCFLEGLNATPAVFSVDTRGTVEEHAHLLDLLTSWLGVETRPPTHSLLIRRECGKVLALEAHNKETREPHVKLRIDAREPGNNDECNRIWYRFVHFVCGHLRTDSVGIRALTLEGLILARFGVDGFRKLVAETKLANIKELRLLGTDSPAGLPALALLPGDGVHLPKLEYLELYRAPLANPRVGKALLDYFKARRERGIPLMKTLVLRACLSVEDWRADLGKYVGNLLYDKWS
ncbi:hypothetical protein EVG20_g5465 [Dentipellis fragilis]|uniref:Uncharacterized protein n=1 Tax=Dentipellis fragilis TaxID=205917 RepID=A0A4Y9YV88_9AGAM|nr:hypothetical protein EVG20_g5465 [Dentipellis fragilis]